MRESTSTDFLNVSVNFIIDYLAYNHKMLVIIKRHHTDFGSRHIFSNTFCSLEISLGYIDWRTSANNSFLDLHFAVGKWGEARGITFCLLWK